MAGEPRYVMSTLRIKMCGMFTIQAIDDLSPHLEAVKRLWRPHSDKLGFMPAGAFAEYAQKRHIIVALSGEDCIGYRPSETPCDGAILIRSQSGRYARA